MKSKRPELTAMICAKCLRPVDAGAKRCPACAADPLVDGRFRLNRALREDSGGVSYHGTQVEDGRLVRVRALEFRELDRLQRAETLADAAAQLCALEDPALPRALGHTLELRGHEGTLWLIHEQRPGQSPAELAGLDAAYGELLERMLEAGPTQQIVASDLRERAAKLAPAAPLTPDPPRSPPSSLAQPKASPRFLMSEPMPKREGSAGAHLQAAPARPSPARPSPNRDQGRDQGEDIPVMRPEELSRELSQAHHATSAIEYRQRKRLSFARVLVVLVSAAIAALVTYLATQVL